MDTVLAVLYGLGGYDESLPNNNLVEQVVLVEGEDGTWTREVRDGGGNVLDTTPAEAPEDPVATPAANPTPTAPAAPADDTQAKLDALTVLLRAVVDTLPAESRRAVEAALAASGA